MYHDHSRALRTCHGMSALSNMVFVCISSKMKVEREFAFSALSMAILSYHLPFLMLAWSPVRSGDFALSALSMAILSHVGTVPRRRPFVLYVRPPSPDERHHSVPPVRINYQSYTPWLRQPFQIPSRNNARRYREQTRTSTPVNFRIDTTLVYLFNMVPLIASSSYQPLVQCTIQN